MKTLYKKPFYQFPCIDREQKLNRYFTHWKNAWIMCSIRHTRLDRISLTYYLVPLRTFLIEMFPKSLVCFEKIWAETLSIFDYFWEGRVCVCHAFDLTSVLSMGKEGGVKLCVLLFCSGSGYWQPIHLVNTRCCRRGRRQWQERTLQHPAELRFFRSRVQHSTNESAWNVTVWSVPAVSS